MPENTDSTQGVASRQSATLPAVHYVLDPSISRFTVRVFASGVLSAFGHSPTVAVRDFTGEASFVADTLEHASLRVVVQAASLRVADSISDKDRREIESEMQQGVLESTRYPEISYECTRVSVNQTANGPIAVSLAGTLTLHGISRGVTVPAQLALLGDTLRAFGEFQLRQSDFNIKQVSAIGGGLKVKDEVKVSFDLVARKQG